MYQSSWKYNHCQSITSKHLHRQIRRYYGSFDSGQPIPICNPTNSFFTDGVEAFYNETRAFWFLDLVFTDLIINEEVKDKTCIPVDQCYATKTFLHILLSAGKKGLPAIKNEAWIIVTDRNHKELCKKVIERDKCPNGNWGFFFTDDVLMLPNEYKGD